MKTLTGQLPSATTSPAPKITCWLPEQPTGIGMLVFAGGGYGGRSEHEDAGYAKHFSKRGITCFVVAYRLGPDGFRHPAMLEDSLAAIHTVRSNAEELGVDPGKLGVIGSSAGGHLAAHTLVAWDKYESDISLRPDFGVLCYPVILSTGPHVNEGSIKNLAGESPSPEILEELSCEKHVTADTPPCFLWHTAKDAGVPPQNSMAFAAALQEHGVSHELHIYARGRHGLGLGTEFPWWDDCLRWLKGAACSTPPAS